MSFLVPIDHIKDWRDKRLRMGKDAACRPQQFLKSIRLRNPSPLHRGSILIVKKKGYISVGRQHVAEEYIVIVFKGAHVPFVLRKREEQYLLVGDVYVNGGSRERGKGFDKES